MFLLLLGCSLFASDTGDTGAYAGCDRDPPLDYDSFGEGVMNKHCTGCHSSYLPDGQRYGAPLGVDLNTYQGVLTWAERIRDRTLDLETMPPGGGLSEQDLLMIDEWLRCDVARDLELLSAEEGGE